MPATMPADTMSPGLMLIHHVWNHTGHTWGQSWERINGTMRDAVQLAIGAGLRFDKDDFEKLPGRSGYYFDAMRCYTLACRCGARNNQCNKTACEALEETMKMRPWIWRWEKTPHRTYPGLEFMWDGRTVRITSMADDKIIACHYGEDARKPKKRYTISREDWDAHQKPWASYKRLGLFDVGGVKAVLLDERDAPEGKRLWYGIFDVHSKYTTGWIARDERHLTVAHGTTEQDAFRNLDALIERRLQVMGDALRVTRDELFETREKPGTSEAFTIVDLLAGKGVDHYALDDVRCYLDDLGDRKYFAEKQKEEDARRAKEIETMRVEHGDVRVGIKHVKQAGLCLAGALAFLMEHFPKRIPEGTTPESLAKVRRTLTVSELLAIDTSEHGYVRSVIRCAIGNERGATR